MKRNTLLAPLVSLGLVLAACGGDDDTALDPPAANNAASDEASGDTDETLRAPTPIEAVSSSSSGSAAGASAATQASPRTEPAEVATSDMMIAPFIAEYVVGADLPPLPTADTGYLFDAAVDVTADDVRRLAGALGVTGDPVQDEWGAWIVGPDDGSAPTVWLHGDAQGGWSYSGPWADGSVIEPCAVTIDSEGNESGGDCPAPEPLVGVPSAEEAETAAKETLTTLGVDVSTLTFETFADEWAANVSVDDRQADRPALRYWNFGYGAEGALQWAGGSLTTPQPVGPYPLVDLDTAMERLRDQGGFGVPMPLLDGPVVAEADAITSSGSATEPADEGDTADLEEPMETIVVDEPFDPEPVVVKLVDVQPDLWWVWDADGNVWMVPAYRFIDTNGGWHTVPAVTDEFLMQADPVDGPIPVEPGDGIGDGAEPLPPPESLPVEPDEPIDVRPADDPEVALSVLDEYVGLSIEEFTGEAEALGYTTRVAVQDGEALPLTADFSTSRVNVEVEGPRVVALVSIG